MINHNEREYEKEHITESLCCIAEIKHCIVNQFYFNKTKRKRKNLGWEVKGTCIWILTCALLSPVTLGKLFHKGMLSLLQTSWEGRRRRGQRMRWLDDITDSMDMSLSKLREFDGQGSLVCCSPWGCKELDTTEWLNWTEKIGLYNIFKEQRTVPDIWYSINVSGCCYNKSCKGKTWSFVCFFFPITKRKFKNFLHTFRLTWQNTNLEGIKGNTDRFEYIEINFGGLPLWSSG